MWDINAKTSNLSLGNTITVTFNFNWEPSSKADRVGDGIVYNVSDCGFPNVRYYGFGGDGPGSACDSHFLSRCELDWVWKNKPYNA